jgi:hypothetical protein
VKPATNPFHFSTVSYLTRVENQRAVNACELRDGLKSCSDASIFHHTFQSLGRHHFLTAGFSNDFAQWALAALNRPELAEQLAALDVRNYTSLASLRNDLWQVLDTFCQSHPDDVSRPAFEPFHFLASVEVTTPLGWEAWTLAEFREQLDQAGRSSFHFHFLVSRLRLHLQTNDFSFWFAEELGLDRLARLANWIDISTNTLDGAKAKLLNLIDRELAA